MWKYYVLRLAFLLLGRLSLRSLYGIAHLVGDGAYFTRRSARRDVIANMRRVMGPDAPERAVRRNAREVFRNATRYYADLFHIRRMTAEQFLQEDLELEGDEHLASARDSGRGVVVASAHFGNPEIVVQGLAAKGFLFYALTEPLQPQALSDFTHWLRSGHGHKYRTVSFGAVKEALRRVKAGGLIAILMDRDVGGSGVPMQLCGAETPIPLGAIEIAMRTGAALIPAWTWRIPGYRFRVRIEPPLELTRTGDYDQDLRTNAQRLLALFETHLCADPGQWAVLESIWETDGNEPSSSVRALQ